MTWLKHRKKKWSLASKMPKIASQNSNNQLALLSCGPKGDEKILTVRDHATKSEPYLFSSGHILPSNNFSQKSIEASTEEDLIDVSTDLKLTKEDLNMRLGKEGALDEEEYENDGVH